MRYLTSSMFFEIQAIWRIVLLMQNKIPSIICLNIINNLIFETLKNTNMKQLPLHHQIYLN